MHTYVHKYLLIKMYSLRVPSHPPTQTPTQNQWKN